MCSSDGPTSTVWKRLSWLLCVHVASSQQHDRCFACYRSERLNSTLTAASGVWGTRKSRGNMHVAINPVFTLVCHVSAPYDINSSTSIHTFSLRTVFLLLTTPPECTTSPYLSLANVCVKRGGCLWHRVSLRNVLFFRFRAKINHLTVCLMNVWGEKRSPVQMAEFRRSENKPQHFQKQELETNSVRMCTSHTEDCSGKINMHKRLDVVVCVYQTFSSTLFKIRPGWR